MTPNPFTFEIAINRLYPGEKLADGDPRWGGYKGGFRLKTHSTESLLAEVRQGYAFCCVLGACDKPDCGRPDGYRVSRHFVSAQVISLEDDTEDERSSLDALEEDPFVLEHGAFLYTTISHTSEKPRARVVFILDEPITDPEIYRLYKAALMDKHGISDSSVMDEARLFYGAKGCVYRVLGNALYLDILQEVAEGYLTRLHEQVKRERRDTPHVPDDLILGTTAAERYVSRAIQEEVDWLASRVEGTGERHRGLLVSALKLESLRQADWLPPKVRERIDPCSELLPAAEATVYIAKYGEETAWRTIEDGISYTKPRSVPKDWTQTDARGESAKEPVISSPLEFPSPDRCPDLETILTKVKTHFPNARRATEAALSAAATLLLEDNSNPMALILEGVASSSKTTVLAFFDQAAPLAYRTDKFTTKAFVSHHAAAKKGSLAQVDLLPRIRHRVMITPELAPLFRGREEDLIDNFTTLTAVLDGHGLTTDSGTHGRRGYVGDYLFAWLGATTPLPSKTWRIMAQLGSRLFFWPMPDDDPTDEELDDAITGGMSYPESTDGHGWTA